MSIKDYNRSYYISTLFVSYKYYLRTVLLLYLDIELKKLFFSNYDRNIVVGKFVWWRNYLINTYNHEIPPVPFFRIFYKIVGQNKTQLDSYIELIDKADIVIAHNGDKFDLRKLNTRFLFHELGTPSSYQSIDT